jgi:hypothetical protein
MLKQQHGQNKRGLRPIHRATGMGSSLRFRESLFLRETYNQAGANPRRFLPRLQVPSTKKDPEPLRKSLLFKDIARVAALGRCPIEPAVRGKGPWAVTWDGEIACGQPGP